MNDETKEILDELKNEDRYIEDYGYQYKRISLEDTKILLDYITNLQQENERLKEENNEDYVYLSRKYDWIADYNMKLIEKLVTLEDYKSRCEKAIEYIKQQNVYYGFCDDLLNILQNGGEDNE